MLEMLESVQQGGGGVSGGACVDYHQHGHLQHHGYFGATASHTVIAVEQAHVAFGHTDFGVLGIGIINVLKMGFRSQEGI